MTLHNVEVIHDGDTCRPWCHSDAEWLDDPGTEDEATASAHMHRRDVRRVA